MADLLDEIQGLEQRIVTRMKELEPAVAEWDRLQAAAHRLGIEVPRRPSAEESVAPAAPQPAPAPAPGPSRQHPGPAGGEGAGSPRYAEVARTRGWRREP